MSLTQWQIGMTNDWVVEFTCIGLWASMQHIMQYLGLHIMTKFRVNHTYYLKSRYSVLTICRDSVHILLPIQQEVALKPKLDQSAGKPFSQIEVNNFKILKVKWILLFHGETRLFIVKHVRVCTYIICFDACLLLRAIIMRVALKRKYIISRTCSFSSIIYKL